MFFLRLILIIVAILPLTVLVIGAYFLWRDAQAAAWDDLEWRSGVAAENASRIFVTDVIALRQMQDLLDDMSEAEIVANQQEIHMQLLHIGGGISQLRNLYVLDAQGKLLVASDIYPVKDISSANSDFFTAARDGRGDTTTLLASRLKHRKTDGKLSFAIVRARSYRGKFAGIVGVSMSLNNFQRGFTEYRLGVLNAGSSIALLRADGAVIARVPTPDLKTIDHLATGFREVVAHGGGRFAGKSGHDGVYRWMFIRKVGEYPFYVSASVPFKTIFQHWLASFAPHLIFGLPAYVALIVMVALTIRSMRLALQEQNQRLAAEQAANSAQKMEAIGRLAGGIAHDFNNALTVIIGHTEIALAHKPHDRGLLTVQAAASNAASLVNRILSFSRDHAAHAVVVEANTQMHKIAQVLPAAMSGGIITLDVRYCREPCAIEVDPVEFEMALLNLCINARDAMPEGGSIVISLERQEAMLAVIVTDTGSGMTEEVRQRAFEPFFTTKPVGKGTGIGLPQVATFVRNSGGRTLLSSEVGRGTQVILELPISTKPLTPVVSEAAPVLATQQRRILLIEDDAPVAEVIEMLLRSVGYDVTWESRAQPALDRLEDEAFDLVLSDIRMPGGKTGFDIASEMKRKYPQTPLILITGYTEDLEQAGVAPVLLKPVRREVLVDAIREAIQKMEAAS